MSSQCPVEAACETVPEGALSPGRVRGPGPGQRGDRSAGALFGFHPPESDFIPFLSAMQKFEKVPESKVVFDAEVATGVRSRVPGSESPLAQCLAGEGQACGHLGNERCANMLLQDQWNRTAETSVKIDTLVQHFGVGWILSRCIYCTISLKSS